MREQSKIQNLVVGLDLGTTTCKAVALDDAGRVVVSAESEYGLQVDSTGWVEQEPEEVWRGVERVLRSLVEQIGADRVMGLALSGAMHTLLPVAADGAPLAPAMSWADSRAAPQVRDLRARTDAHALYLRTGCPLRSTYHPARLRWWREAATDLTKKAARWVSLKDWALFRLSGSWATDASYASTTGLLAIHQREWDPEALKLAGINEAQLAPLVSSAAVAGRLTGEAARRVSLYEGVPVVAGGSDGGMALLGARAGRDGAVVITVGTSGAIRRMVDTPLLDPGERTWCYVLDEDMWFAGGAINNGGLTLEWVREKLYAGVKTSYSQLMADAASVEPGAAGLFVLPYFTGERSPYWNPNLRATFYGLDITHTRAHITRAALEGVAYCMRDIWQALGDGLPHGATAYLTGGITDSPLWAQILADVLGVPLVPVEQADASALGAALVGFAALGRPVSSTDQAARAPDTVVEPNAGRHSFYVERHRVFQELARHLTLLQRGEMGI
ncbi:MAG: gluconokinase [Ardenticatenaceae bacterium]